MLTHFPILLVDDDPNLAHLLNRAAQSTFAEASFIAIHSFNEAVNYLDSLQGCGPRLILLDLNLQSESNGFDFLSLIRRHPQGRLVPIVLLSANQELATIEEGYSRGANAFTAKPFEYHDWQAYVGQLRTYWFKTVTIPKLWFETTQ